MRDGYAYEYTGRAKKWQGTKESCWDMVVYDPTGDDKLVGGRYIDGCFCRVFLCPDGKYRAQNKLS